MGIIMHVVFVTQHCLCGISLYGQVMPPRQAMSIRNEEDDSSVGSHTLVYVSYRITSMLSMR
jgi:hypothetical protein